MRKALFALVFAAAAVALGWAIKVRLDARAAGGRATERGPTPVEVAPIEIGPIEDRRLFSGSLEAIAEFVVAPKVGGRIERILVDLADTVTRGQVVAELEDDEFQQAVKQAKAEVAVATANEEEAVSRLAIAERALDRQKGLRARGVSSDQEFDAAEAERLERTAALAVAKARVLRANAEYESAKIRLGYTRVRATWTDGKDERVVAYRVVDAGETVGPNAPLMSVVELDPINAVIYVTERDYAALRPGQTVELATDAWPGRTFPGTVARVAPVFRQSSRQARVEVSVKNPAGELRPGMFVTATATLGRATDATIVPLAALESRGGEIGVFVIDGATARWRVVEPRIRDGERVQITGDGLTGRVVTLGQQLLTDGSRISIPADVR